MGLLSRIGLQGRLTLFISITMAVTVGVSVYLGLFAVDETEESAQRQQLTRTARTVADHVDDVLMRTVGREEHLATMVANAWSEGEPELTTLLDAYPRLLFESDLYLFRSRGELVWSMRAGAPIPRGVFAEPLVTESVESLRSTVGSCAASTTQDRSRACFASPVLLEDDEPIGVLLAQIDLTRPDLNLFSLERLNELFRIELVAGNGLILAANQPGVGETSAHAEALAALPSQERSGDAVHRRLVEGEQSDHRFGYASTSTVPGWGVVVEPEDEAALATVASGQQRLLLFALVALLASLALAWLAARQLFKPLHALAAKGAQMVGGDLSTPIALARPDEVGALAQVLERLRIGLKTALADAQEVRRQGTVRGRLLDGLFLRQEEERQRVAHQLHEETLQSVAALALGLDSVEDQLNPAQQHPRDQVIRARSMALALIQDLRRMAIELRPPALNELGLASALRSYAESRLSEKGLRYHFDASGMERRPSPLIEISLYRAAQEAIDNIATHAEAKTVDITLKSDGRLLTLVVEDDGKGFEPAEVLADPNAARGLGILSMQERMSLAGGTFKIESQPGQGTRVRAEIPVTNG